MHDRPNITVREPDTHHNNWGIELRWEETPDDCEEYNRQILFYARDKGWQPFHQGGSHFPENDFCQNRWHYWEFWGLPGEAYDDTFSAKQYEYKGKVEQLVLLLKERR